jgi:hypothetical protein
MRLCSKCRGEDRAEVDPESLCKCGAVAAGHEDHDPRCPRLIHEVRRYLVRVSPKELMPDQSLSPYFISQGWTMFKDGERLYRWMYLCRACIRAQEDVLTHRQEYEKACKAAKGLEDRTYAQMIARQSF